MEYSRLVGEGYSWKPSKYSLFLFFEKKKNMLKNKRLRAHLRTLTLILSAGAFIDFASEQKKISQSSPAVFVKYGKNGMLSGVDMMTSLLRTFPSLVTGKVSMTNSLNSARPPSIFVHLRSFFDSTPPPPLNPVLSCWHKIAVSGAHIISIGICWTKRHPPCFRDSL